MMKIYKVLWIDDQWDEQGGFLIDAEQEGIDITPFKTSKAGMEAFENDIVNWDGVILDAKVFNESEDEVAKITGLSNSISVIDRLSDRRFVPYFVYTGQADLIESDLFEDMLRGKGFYKKPTDRERLFNDIKVDADKQLETQIRHKYTDAFEVCMNKYIGVGNQDKLLRILIAVEQNETNNPSYFNEIRKIIEAVFSCCNDKGLFPADCIAISTRSTHLGKKEMEKYVPCYIQRNIHSVVIISQEGSHRLSIDNDVATGKSPYLLKSTTFELINILLWLKVFVDTYKDKVDLETTKEAAIEVEVENEWIRGEIIKIAENGFGTFLSTKGDWTIIPAKVKANNLNEGDVIEITTKNENKKHIDKIRII